MEVQERSDCWGLQSLQSGDNGRILKWNIYTPKRSPLLLLAALAAPPVEEPRLAMLVAGASTSQASLRLSACLASQATGKWTVLHGGKHGQIDGCYAEGWVQKVMQAEYKTGARRTYSLDVCNSLDLYISFCTSFERSKRYPWANRSCKLLHRCSVWASFMCFVCWFGLFVWFVSLFVLCLVWFVWFVGFLFWFCLACLLLVRYVFGCFEMRFFGLHANFTYRSKTSCKLPRKQPRSKSTSIIIYITQTPWSLPSNKGKPRKKTKSKEHLGCTDQSFVHFCPSGLPTRDLCSNFCWEQLHGMSHGKLQRAAPPKGCRPRSCWSLVGYLFFYWNKGFLWFIYYTLFFLCHVVFLGFQLVFALRIISLWPCWMRPCFFFSWVASANSEFS